jgi:hypothetical protein
VLNIRRAIFVTMGLSLLLLGTVAAQDAGQYVILNAQFGTERNHVDVTNRLRELARTDRPFRVNRDSMAADPDYGRVKVLRVFARGPHGQERMFEFPEGSWFDSAQFRGWRRGDWGDERWQGGWAGRANNDAGNYLILSAQYGTEYRHVDVTSRLKELAREDRVFRLGNRTMGVDPAEGQVKVLRIFARGPDGRESMFEYEEHSLIDGDMFRGWGTGEWGAGWSGNWNGGGYSGDAGQFLILSAQYGSERSHVDVTNRLRELARADVQFRMGNRSFGVDPDPGVVKVLRIYARGPNGRERVFEYREGSMVDGAMFRGWSRGEWAGENERWSGRWEGEEREERERERNQQ